MLFFNVSHGYLDGILRGYKSGLITKSQYTNFTQCETIEDLKVQLTSATDYEDCVQDISGPVKPGLLAETMQAKFVQDFRYLRCNADGKLARFLDFVTVDYMIDNVVMIITGVMRGEDLDRDELIARCHPLGLTDLLPALTVSRSLLELYNTVLVDTPLGPYFKDLVKGPNGLKELNELNVEIIRMALGKAYLEDFDCWCREECDWTTASEMHALLSFEADRRAMNIAVNSIGTGLPKDLRLRLLPRLGRIYEAGLTEKLACTDDLYAIRSMIDAAVPAYRPLISAAVSATTTTTKGDSESYKSDQQHASFESVAAEMEVAMCKDTFIQQCSFAPFYAWCKLREQERRNVVWIAECIYQQHKDNIHQYIPIF